jgi:TM2 domain-containing membrane protein YozV
MMRMMGLGTVAYWTINYLFWFVIYLIYTAIFVVLGSVVYLPSGYKLGMFTRQAYGQEAFHSNLCFGSLHQNN